MEKTKSKYRKDICSTFTTTNSNITIDAAPGSGKTSVLIDLSKLLHPFKKGIFLAFNKSIAAELRRRLPEHITTSTIHSYCMKILTKYLKHQVIVQESKTFFLIRKKLQSCRKFKNEKTKIIHLSNLCKLYDLYRMNLCKKDMFCINDLADKYDIEYEDEYYSDFLKVLDIVETYNNHLETGSMIDFTDMLYLVNTIPISNFVRYDVVFVDEAQDLNSLQKNIIEKIVKSNGRSIFVGDKKQGIYNFQGASLDCFLELTTKSNTINLPLSVSYRCSKSIIKEANKIFSEESIIEPFEDNEEGEVREGNVDEIREGDFVLCRNNKPLIDLFLQLLKSGKSAYIYGKDYGETLLKLLNEVEDLNEDYISTHFDQKLEKLYVSLREKGISNPTSTPKYNLLVEKIDILNSLKKHYGSYRRLSEVVQNLFRDEIKGITLMTCHKSKGLENDRVFIYKKELIPSPYATSPEMQRAEKCLMYVAITRAKKELIYID